MSDTQQITPCETCGADLEHSLVAFGCDILPGWFCEECWPAVRCEEDHEEGCSTSVFNCPM